MTLEALFPVEFKACGLSLPISRRASLYRPKSFLALDERMLIERQAIPLTSRVNDIML